MVMKYGRNTNLPITADLDPRSNLGLREITQDSTVKFYSGDDQTEMLRITPDGFWVRGVKVAQDDSEAAHVYRAFRQWLAWANLQSK